MSVLSSEAWVSGIEGCAAFAVGADLGSTGENTEDSFDYVSA